MFHGFLPSDSEEIEILEVSYSWMLRSTPKLAGDGLFHDLWNKKQIGMITLDIIL